MDREKKITLEQFISELLDVVDAYEIENLYLDDLLQVLKKENVTIGNIEGLIADKFEKYGEYSNSLHEYLINDNLYQKEQHAIET